MKDKDIGELIGKARLSLSAARNLLENGYTDFSASRAYYAMFYAAEAILLTQNLSFSKHKAVISALGKHFVQTGIIPGELHRHISNAFNIRQAGDYGSIGSVSEEKARLLIRDAEKFIKAIVEYLKKNRI